MSANYARIKSRVMNVMGDEEGSVVMEYIDKLKNSGCPEAMEIVKAVAHIGIDWGYGKFELTSDHIDKARSLYEQKETE